MIAALAPECRVSSMAHVVAFGHVPGRGRLRIVETHGAHFFKAIEQPPPLWAVWVGSRASGSVSLGDGEFIRLLCVLYPRLLSTLVSAP